MTEKKAYGPCDNCGYPKTAHDWELPGRHCDNYQFEVTPPKPLEAFENRDHRQECQLRYITADEARLRGFGCTCPKPLEPRRQARIICDATGCGEWNCDDCHPETQLPKPLEPPQEICEQKPLCPCVCHKDGEPYCGDCMDNRWAREPKPAPQTEGFEEWWDKYLANRTIAPFPEPWMMVNGRQAALTSWTAAQVSLLQNIAELEEKLRDTKRALELLAAGVVEECSESLESGDLVAMAVRLAIDTARRERTGND